MNSPKFRKAKLATALGLSVEALDYHLVNSPDVPPIGDLGAWEVFLAAHGRVETSPTSLREKIARKRLEILTETKEAMARKAARERDETADKGEVRDWMRGFMALLFSELDRVFGMEMPASLKGLSEVEIKKRSDAAITELKATLRKRFEEQL